MQAIPAIISPYALSCSPWRPPAYYAIHATGLSVRSGVALVALGVIVNVSSVFSHIDVIHKLKTGTWVPGQVSKSAVALAVLLALVGIGMAAYLLFVH